MQKYVPAVHEQPTREERDAAAAEKAAADAAAGPPPLRLTLAAAVAAVEGLAVVVWGVTMFFGGSGKSVLAGLLVLVLAGFPLGAAYGLRKARRWSRGPALIIQLLSLPIAWTLLHSDGGGFVAGGAVLGALALTCLVLLAHPATTDALGISRTAS
ncbi:hypothetical protein SAMN05216251_112165 [Actinacidiphila alni]|uniref:Integral membrane protein n=2 Tax=Actinacidiphila alni TaxID=380248 RepID=A0A1I2I381_9ACTN|nr:hypothetical protein SAMN05216251_112165 [Actinacidiphila alni]